MQPWFIVSLFDIEHYVMVNWHQSKQGVFFFSVTCFLNWLLTKCWFFNWIAGSCQGTAVTCCKLGWFVQKPVNAGLKVNWCFNFSCSQMFFTAFSCVFLDCSNLKQMAVSTSKIRKFWNLNVLIASYQQCLKWAYNSVHVPTWVIQTLNTNGSCERNVEITAGSDTCHLDQQSSAS